jgi:hypothetical protein
MTITMTKVTSLDSQSGAPTAPNATPATERNDPIDPPPEMDYEAVAKILRPIQESLNEAALEAGYPSPPINSPEALSPAPSVTYRRSTQTRGRGFSLIGDRLAQLKIDSRKFRHHDGDMTSVNLSAEPSVADEEEGDMASVSMLSDDGSGKHNHGRARTWLASLDPKMGSVPIALGSPALNPRIEEYLSFTSKDLPAKTVAPCFPSTLMETSTSSIKTIVEPERSSQKSDGGVTEKSNWAEEVDDAVDRACMRLEQLAKDEHQTDSTKSFDEYYISRLERLLSSEKRRVKVSLQRVEDLQG